MLDDSTAVKALEISKSNPLAPAKGSVSIGLEMAVAAYKLP